jgi:hypothetical protein
MHVGTVAKTGNPRMVAVTLTTAMVATPVLGLQHISPAMPGHDECWSLRASAENRTAIGISLSVAGGAVTGGGVGLYSVDTLRDTSACPRTPHTEGSRSTALAPRRQRNTVLSVSRSRMHGARSENDARRPSASPMKCWLLCELNGAGGNRSGGRLRRADSRVNRAA